MAEELKSTRSVVGEDLESVLGRIPNVKAARVVSGLGGRVSEVHVLADRGRSPKQIVRDVQSVAMASFGVEIDYRTVSVVQLDEPSQPGNAPQPGARPAGLPRIALLRVGAEIKGHLTETHVLLAANGKEYVGTARGPGSSGLKLVARAVVDAIAGFAEDSAIDVDFADVLGAGPHSVAVTVVRLASPRGDHVASGSAVVRKDANDAMARAALAALNRLVASF